MKLSWLRKILPNWLQAWARRKAVKNLATIGYEGTTVPSFIKALRTAKVKAILDVRAIALSRRKGFSKTALANALEANGIAYIHLADLGNPKHGREAAKNGRVSEFRRIFERHLKTNKAQKALDEAVAIVSRTYTCLLCLEWQPSQCHRAIVAEALAKRGNLRIVHLSVRKEDATNVGSKNRN